MALGIFICGLLCVVMVEMAANAPPECRRSAVMVAAALVLDWVLFNAAWIKPIAPAHLLVVVGFPASHEGTWAVTDAIIAAFILGVAADHAWALILWALLFTQVMITAFAPASLLQILDVLFYAQVAVFFFIGGKGSAERFGSYLRSFARGARHAFAMVKA